MKKLDFQTWSVIGIISFCAFCSVMHVLGQERALVDPQGNIIRYERPSTSSGGEWRPVTRQDQPAYDPATQKLERQIDIQSDEVIVLWNVVPLTQEEIDTQVANEAETADRQVKRANVGGAVATLRQWADDAEGTTVTSGNAVNVLQTVVNRLGIFFDRFADLVEAQGLDQ